MEHKETLPWGISNQQIQPGSMKTITESKLATFAIGQQKKSRFQKAREEKEAKKQEEEKAAAQLFDTFVASFTGEEDSKTFVRGGGNTRGEPGGGEVYKLDSRMVNRKANSEMDMLMDEMKAKEQGSSRRKMSISESSSSNINNNGKKDRHIDEFLSEIKNKQEGNDASSFFEIASSNKELQKGSYDNGDPYTTNIHVGNLAPAIAEEDLYELFGQYGDVNSIKVMWPRTEEEKARKRNTGFVSFMRRSDAEEALDALQGYSLQGFKLTLGWGKAVIINSCPFLLPNSSVSINNNLNSSNNSNVNSHSASNINSTINIHTITNNINSIISNINATVSATTAGDASLVEQTATATATVTAASAPTAPPTFIPPPPLPPLSVMEHSNIFNNVISNTATTPSTSSSKWDALPSPSIITPCDAEASIEDAEKLVIPSLSELSAQSIQIMNTLALFVASDGDAIEKAIKLREEANEDFQFLFQPTSPAGLYYRWRTYVNLMGDNELQWRSQPFQIACNGPFIIPPEPLPKQQNEKRRRSRSHSVDSDAGNSDAKRGRSSSPHKHHGDDREGRRPHGSSGDDRISRRRRSRSRSNNNSRNRRRSRSRSRDRFNRDSRDSNNSSSLRDSSRRGRQSVSEIEKDRKRFSGMTGAQIERIKAQERGKVSSLHSIPLTEDEYDDFEEILQNITLCKEDIKVAMGFAYDKIESAEEIVTLLKESLLLSSTPPAVKMARLYVLSDILHNSSAAIKYATNYRMLIQGCLPEIFESMGNIKRSGEGLGRMISLVMDDKIKTVISVWSNWSIFTSNYLHGLEFIYFATEEEVSKYANAATAGGPSSASDSVSLDSLRRQASLIGVFLPASVSKSTASAKINTVNGYIRNKLTSTLPSFGSNSNSHNTTASISSSSVVMDFGGRSPVDSDVDGEELTLDDIDGVPMVQSTNSNNYSSNINTTVISGTNRGSFLAVDVAYDDDVDGVAMDD